VLSFLERDAKLLVFLVVCEDLYVSCSKGWCSSWYQLRIYL